RHQLPPPPRHRHRLPPRRLRPLRLLLLLHRRRLLPRQHRPLPHAPRHRPRRPRPRLHQLPHHHLIFFRRQAMQAKAKRLR
ncbi:hypothetical protein KEM55_000899, partial [Ascosphaera atra]